MLEAFFLVSGSGQTLPEIILFSKALASLLLFAKLKHCMYRAGTANFIKAIYIICILSAIVRKFRNRVGQAGSPIWLKFCM